MIDLDSLLSILTALCGTILRTYLSTFFSTLRVCPTEFETIKTIFTFKKKEEMSYLNFFFEAICAAFLL